MQGCAELPFCEWNARPDGPHIRLGETWLVPMWAAFETLGPAPRRATPYR